MGTKNMIKRKFSTIIISFVLFISMFTIMSIENCFTTADAVTVKGSFAFSYTAGNYVDGSTNSKFYSLNRGDNLQLYVKTLSGATESNKVNLQVRNKQSNGITVIEFSKNIYRVGTYDCGKVLNTSRNYHLYAKGGAGTGLYNRITGSGDVECY